jgi:hypothetical protein
MKQLFKNGEKKGNLYYLARYEAFVPLYQFCSEEFICENCFRNTEIRVKGFTRFDSLVVCKEHYKGTLAINEKLILAINGAYNDENSKLVDKLVNELDIN